MAETVLLDGVGKRFRRGREELPVLREVAFRVAPGEVVALLGPSGCGKSTLLRLIGGLDRPSEGRVLLGDRPVTKADPRCAIVFQEPRLFPWKSVSANVAVGARRLAHGPERPKPNDWLGLVGLDGFGGSLPHQLSGGMAQRAALARALIGRPGVLLLDEPFASLDALTRLRMQDLLADVCHRLNPTVLLVTHDVDEALFLADRIVLLSGRPATVASTIAVPLAHPRDRADPILAPLRARILAHFGFEEHGVAGRTSRPMPVGAEMACTPPAASVAGVGAGL
jgi:ABC-type nitrate/sulfonate/bicarbonate transport system ATPase subunit